MAAETHVMQKVLDKAIGIKTFLHHIGIIPKSTKVLTDNLSLKRVIYSGRQTQETRLRREIAIIRDVAINENVLIRFVATEDMVADDLTKITSGPRIREFATLAQLEMVEDNDVESPTHDEVKQAAEDIPLLRDEDENPKNSEMIIVNISDDSSVASIAPPPRRFARMSTCGKEPGQKKRGERKSSETRWFVSNDN